jgi:hypothetical protein
MSHHYLFLTPHSIEVLSLCHWSVLHGRTTGGCRSEGHSEEKGQGEGGVHVKGDADPPGPRSFQHRASHFSSITLFPCLPPPCHHDLHACVCHRLWPDVFFCSNGSCRGQITIPISSLTLAESSLSASASMATSCSEMRSWCFSTFCHFPASDSQTPIPLGRLKTSSCFLFLSSMFSWPEVGLHHDIVH